MITRIRNAVRAKMPRVDIPLPSSRRDRPHPEDEGYIANYKVTRTQAGRLRVYLKYGPAWSGDHGPAARQPSGCRIYCGKDQIPRVFGGLGINVLSTSRGVMTGRSAAREGVGGEILFNVW
jgi:small subunit ribosomal protein S8